MRFPDELLPPSEMVEVDDKAFGDLAGSAGRELEMAQRLVDEMTVAWNPGAYHDTYREDLLKRIEARIEAGETHELAPAVAEAAPEGAQIIAHDGVA
jgi:DNA end-binding protein Ku